MQFDLVTPEKLLVSTTVDYVNVPGTEGYFGVLTGHQPVISTLNEGVVETRSGNETAQYKVKGGFVDVDGEKVTILAEQAEEIQA